MAAARIITGFAAIFCFDKCQTWDFTRNIIPFTPSSPVLFFETCRMRYLILAVSVKQEYNIFCKYIVAGKDLHL